MISSSEIDLHRDIDGKGKLMTKPYGKTGWHLISIAVKIQLKQKYCTYLCENYTWTTRYKIKSHIHQKNTYTNSNNKTAVNRRVTVKCCKLYTNYVPKTY